MQDCKKVTIGSTCTYKQADDTQRNIVELQFFYEYVKLQYKIRYSLYLLMYTDRLKAFFFENQMEPDFIIKILQLSSKMFL